MARKDKTHKGLSRKEYDKELVELHAQLVTLQSWVKHAGARIMVVFEGRDAAGKGGVIKAITERVSPRVFKVVALATPSDREKSQMYMQRFVPHFPAAGEVVIFDRSWYNRAGVEKVMGFCTKHEYERFLSICPSFERLITDYGIILVKYWFEVSQEEQTRRFHERIKDPRKGWKLSPMDLESHRRARLNCVTHLLSLIPYKAIPAEDVKLPKRQKPHGYKAPDYKYRFVPEKY
jgi:polyphosphate kinase 2